jgi:lysophospholipase L1-like esterase
MRVFVSICLAVLVGVMTLNGAPAPRKKAPVKRAAFAKKRAPVKKTAVRRTAARRTAARRRSVAFRAPAVSASVRNTANSTVLEWLNLPGNVENPAALIPFFEQLYRLETGETNDVLRVFHYGDSHTAADGWSGTLRYLLQARFGDGGNGFSHAGRPWLGYRRLDLKSWSTKGWYSDGLAGREGDGLYGLAGVSMSAQRPGEMVNLQTDAQRAEFHYLRQPGGGRVEISDNGAVLDVIDTDGPGMPVAHPLQLAPGSHLLTARTLDRKPVRLHGWVTENNRGVTWEMMGINGAQASIGLKWEDAGLAPVYQQRPPSLIVLAYGTNEARNKDWTYESYRDMFASLIDKYRRLAPAAAILAIGPPDHQIRTRAGWAPHEKIDLILEAQRAACRSRGVAFWDIRERMGGKGAMRQWVFAGMAQPDYVHFTAPGYRLLGAALYKELMAHFSTFARVRRETMAPTTAALAAPEPNGQTNTNP